jgi:hypothetical protein
MREPVSGNAEAIVHPGHIHINGLDGGGGEEVYVDGEGVGRIGCGGVTTGVDEAEEREGSIGVEFGTGGGII